MATSKVDICNLGLSYLGSSPITSIDDPSSNEEKICRKWYDLTLEEALSLATPNFAVKRAVIAVDTEAPAFGWEYAYTLPQDCVKFLSIGSAEENTQLSFDIEGDKLLTDEFSESGLNIRYISKVTDVTKYTAQFIKFFCLLLAANIAYDITNDEQIGGLRRQEARAELQNSRQRDNTESKILIVYNSKYKSARGGYPVKRYKK